MCTGITSRGSPTFVTSYDHATETEIVILLLVWYFLGPNLLDEEAAVKFAWDVISYIRIYHLVKQGCACLLSSVAVISEIPGLPPQCLSFIKRSIQDD